MAERGIARLWKPVINVTDLDVGERFWSAVAGLTPQGRHEDGNFSVLADDDSDADSRGDWILLQLVADTASTGPGGTHTDFLVDDVEQACRRVEEIGGTVKRPPGVYPDQDNPVLEWAVLEDPFGNEFCLIRWPL